MTNHLEQAEVTRSEGGQQSCSLRDEYLSSNCLHSASKNEREPINLKGFIEFNDPFSQPGFDDSKTLGDKVWAGIKKIFGQEDTLDDQVKKYVEDKKMTPAEQKKLKQEEELYESEMRRSMTQIGIALPMNFPDVAHDPRFATMRKRDELVRQEEDNIRKTVEKKMGPLMDDVNKELSDYNRTWQNDNPYGTGGFRPHPAPGDTLKVYWEQIRKETERRAHQQEVPVRQASENKAYVENLRF